MITGGADAFSPPTKLLLDQAEAAGAKVLPYRTNAVSFRSIYLFNLQRAPFNDPIARQALTMALDPKKVAAPRDAPTANNISNTDSIWYAKEGTLPKYDPKKAQDLINQWSQKNGGKPLEFTVTDVIGSATLGGSGEAIQAAMAGYQNVKVNVEQVTVAQWNVIGPQGNFDLYPSAFGGADPSNVFDQNFQTGAGRNFTKYSNPTFDAALARRPLHRARRSVRRPTRRRRPSMIKDSYPWIMPIDVWSPSFWVVNNKSIQGYNSGSWMGFDTSQLWLKTTK